MVGEHQIWPRMANTRNKKHTMTKPGLQSKGFSFVSFWASGPTSVDVKGCAQVLLGHGLRFGFTYL